MAGERPRQGESVFKRGSVPGFVANSRSVTIHLCGPPGDCCAASDTTSEQLKSPVWPCSVWGLPSQPSYPDRWCALTAPFHPYLWLVAQPIGGLFSVALSCGSPRLAVSQHTVLWSPDFPRPTQASAAVTQPTHPEGITVLRPTMFRLGRNSVSERSERHSKLDGLVADVAAGPVGKNCAADPNSRCDQGCHR